MKPKITLFFIVLCIAAFLSSTIARNRGTNCFEGGIPLEQTVCFEKEGKASADAPISAPEHILRLSTSSLYLPYHVPMLSLQLNNYAGFQPQDTLIGLLI